LGGALIIIALAHIATITTGLSIASISTNRKVSSGGFYAFISRSMGPEIGGAIGIPLYISQTLSITLYIFGFTEAWINLFPSHEREIVLYVIIAILFILSYLGPNFAMKIQYIIMAGIVVSLISFFLSDQAFSFPITLNINPGTTKGGFWYVFAIFFPAVTGIGSGVAMSGELRDPKRNLPRGILTAIFTGLIIYIAAAFWLRGIGSNHQLITNNLLMAQTARWQSAVMAGILGATFSSALGSFIGAPRILQALAKDKTIPFSRFFADQSETGNPRIAIIFTAILTVISLNIGSLNAVASLLTMFFLISYGAINLTLFIEKAIGMPSFRPTFTIHNVIPLIGFAWCTVIMFLINPLFAILALLLILMLLIYYAKKGLSASYGDVRSGIFNAIGEWAIKSSMKFPNHYKSWKPNLFIPIDDPQSYKKNIKFIKNLISPSGTARLVSINIMQESFGKKIARIFNSDDNVASSKANYYKLLDEINELKNEFSQDGIFSAATVVDSSIFIEGINTIIQTMTGMVLPPNIIFLTISKKEEKFKRLQELFSVAIRESLAIVALSHHSEKDFGNRKDINIWLRINSYNHNLAILLASQLERNWGAKIRFITIAREESEKKVALTFLKRINEKARLKNPTEIIVQVGDFDEVLKTTPAADLNILGISEELRFKFMNKISAALNSTILFVTDSGKENIEA